MDIQGNGSWTKTVRLRVGGGTGPEGSYQYKFNENGSSSGWLADPLNPRSYGGYGNSIVYVRMPTVFQILPVNAGVVATDRPAIKAGVFSSPNSTIDTVASRILLDRVEVSAFSGRYDPLTGMLADSLPSTGDGMHLLTILAVDMNGRRSEDSVAFTVRGAPLQWLTRSNARMYESAVTVKGIMFNGTVMDVRVVRNGVDTIPATAAGANFSAGVSLVEGANALQAIGTRNGRAVATDIITLTRLVEHAPRPVITFGFTGGVISLNAVTSTDPDGDPLTFSWRSEDEHNPTPLGVNRTGAIVNVQTPAAAGEYYVTLEATDPSQRTGRVRSFFTIGKDSSVSFATANASPRWVKDAVVYEIFVPSFSAAGTLRGVTEKIGYIKSLGVNTVWLMPIMNNRGTVNEMNGGYDIIDFYDVDESLGTLQDFSALRDSCHANSIKLILDITPNHVSAEHPWVRDVKQWRDESIYRGFVENRVLGNARDLGQSIVTDNGYSLYSRYSNWTLANLNLSTTASFRAMMDVYHFWIDSMRADGFRLDVYWGPQNRYGSAVWWRPFRDEIRRTKPDIFLLGETDGTGTGSEANYADGGGALDAGYDWNWFGQARSTLSAGDVLNMHNRTANYSPDKFYNHFTGPNASYFRFLENHDEDRIAQIYTSAVERTLPGAVLLLTTPGIPMLYAGQEIGWKGRRDKINFDGASKPLLLPYYRRLLQLRGRHSALRSPQISLVSSATSGVYTFLRPGRDENILVLINFNPSPAMVQCAIAESDLQLSAPLADGRAYYLNDVLNDSSYVFTSEDLPRLHMTLGASQSRVLLFADSAFYPIATSADPLPDVPSEGALLEQSYPHPVSLQRRESVSIPFRVPDSGTRSGLQQVQLQLYDPLGRKVADLLNGRYPQGTFAYSVPSTILRALRPGTYFCRLTINPANAAGTVTRIRPMRVLP
jgi:glycosidase